MQLALVTAVLTLALSSPARNVLLIIADDLGVDRVGAYGAHPDPGRTPVLDALAARGVLFRRAWSNPVCSPTRSTILTGRYGFRTGITTSVAFDSQAAFTLAPNEVTLPELLSRTHEVAAIGKWHLGIVGGHAYQDPLVTGFTTHSGHIANINGIQTYTSWTKNVANAAGSHQTVERTYATTDAVDDALDRIARWGDRPWFLWLAFNAPHSPFHDPPDDLHSFDLGENPPPALRYQAMVEAMDTEIGRLLDSLRPTDLSRTTVIFVGDNGTPSQGTTAPSPSGKSKGSVYQGGVHVPLIIAGSGVASPGRECQALVNTTDLFATILDLAGVERHGAGTDSVSLLPYLTDTDATPRRSWAYTEKASPNGFGPWNKRRRAIRNERYKLIVRQPDASLPPLPHREFFDLAADPLEADDLWPDLDEAQATAYDELTGLLERLR